VCNLLTQFTMFSIFKSTYQRNRCTCKKSLKSHIFIFYSAPGQISLFLHQNLGFTYSQSYQGQISLFLHQNLGFTYSQSYQGFFSFSIGTNQRKSCNLKKNIKSRVVFFTARAVRLFYICIKNCVIPTHTV